MKLTKLMFAMALVTSTAHAAELQLDEASIIGTTPAEWQNYQQADSVTSVDQDTITQSVTGLDSVVRALPGTFSYMDTPQGTLTLNIRGTTGLGRSNTLIDGVPQTLFGVTATSEGDDGFHESPPSSSAFGAVIDSSFLVGADVARGGQGGSHGINSLMGSANFRTLGVKDLIHGTRPIGMRAMYGYGTNQLGHKALLAIAGQTSLASGTAGALLAVSGANKSTDYRRGDGKLASSNSYVISKLTRPRSLLAKLEYGDERNEATLALRHYHNNIGGRELSSRAYDFAYHYRPESDLVDISILANQTTNKQDFNEKAKYATLEQPKSLNQSHYLDINNTSYFYPAFGEIVATHGMMYQTNDYQRTLKTTDQDVIDHTVFSPTGRQMLIGLYGNYRLKKDQHLLDLSLSRVMGRLSGIKPACEDFMPCFPRARAAIDKNYQNFNGKIQLSSTFGNWFTPYISYAKTSRIPNVQEMFFTNEAGGSVNPFLQPETADTKEIGFAIHKQNLLQSNDHLGLKVNYYHSKINNYIHTQSFFLDNKNQLTPDINKVGDNAGFNAKISVNSQTPVTSSGLEVQGIYDAGKYFGTLSYTRSQSDQPANANSGHADFGFSGGATDRLPENYWTLGLGTRLLDNRLELSTQIKHYGKSIRLRPDGIDVDTSNYTLQALPKSPNVTDIFAKYQINDQVALRLGIENVFDKLYIHPLNAQNSNNAQYTYDEKIDDYVYEYNNYARGRTLSASATVDF